jgi:hypothetical protein
VRVVAHVCGDRNEGRKSPQGESNVYRILARPKGVTTVDDSQSSAASDLSFIQGDMGTAATKVKLHPRIV